MSRFSSSRMLSIALTGIAASAALLLVSPPALCQPDDSAPAVTNAADQTAKAAEPEPERIKGEIYKLDAETRTVGILVKQLRAFKRYKLVLDDKSIVLVNGQPSNFDALVEGKSVEVGFFDKGKQKVIDSIVVTADE